METTSIPVSVRLGPGFLSVSRNLTLRRLVYNQSWNSSVCGWYSKHSYFQPSCWFLYRGAFDGQRSIRIAGGLIKISRISICDTGLISGAFARKCNWRKNWQFATWMQGAAPKARTPDAVSFGHAWRRYLRESRL